MSFQSWMAFYREGDCEVSMYWANPGGLNGEPPFRGTPRNPNPEGLFYFSGLDGT